MKPLRLVAISLAASTLLISVNSCTSDQNPFDSMQMCTEKPTAKIHLNIDVAATRAKDDLSTADEKKVSKVSVYVFDDSDKLEVFKTDVTVSEGTPIVLEATAGMKTIYAVSAKNVVSAVQGTTMQDFEDTVFDSKMGDLHPSKEFVMVGQSNTQYVFNSASTTDIPASNVFNIELERLIAKTQVKLGNNLNTEAFGFKSLNANFKVMQTCEKMRLKPNGTDVFTTYTGNNKGTFDGYTVYPEGDMPQYVSNGDFSAEDCRYLMENIVSVPKAGNTTFICFDIYLIPEYNYTCDNSGNLSRTANPSEHAHDFYAVGLVDASNGLEDFAIDSQDGKKRVITFIQSDDADRYVSALNAGNTSAITVSESDAPLNVSATRIGTRQVRQFEKVQFQGGDAFYRINIKDEQDKIKVERNKYYKITVNSIKSLGCHSENLLRPTNPEASTEISTSAMVNTQFKVAEWDEINKDVNID